MGTVPPDVRTVHLGAFTPDHAQEITRRLEERHIVWWTKEPGFLSRIWEQSVHVFVDREQRATADRIAKEVLGGSDPPSPAGSSGS
jgi:hypothetical protein